MARLEAVLQNNPSLRDYARSKLLSFVLSVTDEDDLLQMIATGFSRASFSLNGTAPARELFAAIAARWLISVIRRRCLCGIRNTYCRSRP